MTPQEEVKYDKMFDQVGKSHQACPLGRNFMAFGNRDKMTKASLEKYRDGFDRCFPNAPGAGI